MRDDSWLGCAVSLVMALATVGCSSSYQPARSPRISMVMHSGAVAYYKDGKGYPGGFLGGGIVDVVEGNRRAEEEARAARNLIIAGFVVEVAGLVAISSGTYVLAETEASSLEDQPVGAGLVIGGLVGVVTGAIIAGAGIPRIYDAINIYNDGVDSAHAPAAHAPAPPASPPPSADPPPSAK